MPALDFDPGRKDFNAVRVKFNSRFYTCQALRSPEIVHENGSLLTSASPENHQVYMHFHLQLLG